MESKHAEGVAATLFKVGFALVQKFNARLFSNVLILAIYEDGDSSSFDKRSRI